MAEIVVLSDGYSRMVDQSAMLADGTCSLIKTTDELVLVDTLGPWSSTKLISLINNQGYHLEDITYVVCTHGHSDHCGNLNLFTNNTHQMANLIKNQFGSIEDDLFNEQIRPTKIKKHILGNGVYENDRFDFDLSRDQMVTFQINEHIQVRQTPGHTLADVSVLVDNVVNKGRVAITGDLFESEADLKDENIWIEAGSESVDEQRENRQFILDNYDYIIPGHGVMFKVNN